MLDLLKTQRGAIMNTLTTNLNTFGEQTASNLVAAKARFLVSLVQGSQLLEAAALDAVGCSRLVEKATQLLSETPVRSTPANG